MPRFSVIIPTYNRESIIGLTLDSVLGQTFADFQVVVVDDGSTDRTREVAAGYGDRVTLVTQDNRGPGAARNRGAEHAAGEYLCFLDSDDLWFPWTLATIDRALREAGEPTLLIARPERFSDPEQLAEVRQADLAIDRYDRVFDIDFTGLPMSASFLTVRREDYRSVGGMTNQQPWVCGEDVDLVFRLGDRSLVYLREPAVVAYRQHHGSAMSDTKRVEAGFRYRLKKDQRGEYPGRRHEARRWLLQNLRVLTMGMLKGGHRAAAWRMYRMSFTAHASIGRWKWLIGFPLKYLASRFGRPG